MKSIDNNDVALFTGGHRTGGGTKQQPDTGQHLADQIRHRIDPQGVRSTVSLGVFATIGFHQLENPRTSLISICGGHVTSLK